MILRARTVWPVVANPIDDGAIAVGEEGDQAGRILAVEKFRSISRRHSGEVLDLGHGTILPGLINAHTHLELSDLKGKTSRGIRFSDWIREVIAVRAGWHETDFQRSASRGIEECLAHGTTTVTDVASTSRSLPLLKESPLRKLVFRELVNFDPSTANESVATFSNLLDEEIEDQLYTLGISPHSPYTVSKELFQLCRELADERNMPICIHLAETQTELQFLRDGSGELRDLLKERGMFPEDWRAPGMSPVEYMKAIGLMERPRLLIHCNYLSEEDLSLIRASGSSVVICPRSNDYLSRHGHPIGEFFDKGINVALGTDSLASNWSLSMLDELRFASGRYPDIAPHRLIEMATISGARALGWHHLAGSIEPGKQADLIAVSTDERAGSVAEQVLGSREVLLTMVAGKVLKLAERIASSPSA